VKKFLFLLLALLVVGSLTGCNLRANVDVSPGATLTTDDYKTNVNPNVAGDISYDNDKRGPASVTGD
jgi:predicted small lipoprotein YifL